MRTGCSNPCSLEFSVEIRTFRCRANAVYYLDQIASQLDSERDVETKQTSETSGSA